MRKFFLFLLISLFAQSNLLNAQEDSLRKFDESRLEHLSSMERYNYNQTASIKEKSTLVKILDAFFSFLFSTAGIVIMVLALLLIIGLVFRSSIKSKTNTKGFKQSFVLDNLDAENSSQAKLLLLMKEAEQQKNYKLAIRYKFLWILKELDAQKQIVFHVDKTNVQYLKELPFEMQPIFFQLHRIFDFTWYGNYPSNEFLFEKVQELSLSLNSSKDVA